MLRIEQGMQIRCLHEGTEEETILRPIFQHQWNHKEVSSLTTVLRPVTEFHFQQISSQAVKAEERTESADWLHYPH